MSASGIRAALAYIKETTLGVTPDTPVLLGMRATSRGINSQKSLLESAEVASHGQETTVRHGFRSVTGAIGGELLTDAWDDWIAAAMGGEWSSAITVTNLAVTLTAPGTVTRASGSFVTDGLKAGDLIRLTLSPTAGNNRVWMIVAVTALTLTVASSTGIALTTDSSGDARLNVTGHRCDLGFDLQGFTVERQFQDIAEYEVFRGVTPNGMTLSIQPEQIATINFPIVGMAPAAMASSSISGSAVTAPAGGDPIDAFSGGVMEGSSIVGLVTGLEVTVNLQRNLQPIVGSTTSPSIYEGRRQVRGTLTVLFENATMYNKYFNETESTFGVLWLDPDGVNRHSVYFPRVKFNGHPMDPGQTGPVIATVPFAALRSASHGTTMSWYRSNADA